MHYATLLDMTTLVEDYVIEATPSECHKGDMRAPILHWYKVDQAVGEWLYQVGLVPAVILSDTYGCFVGSTKNKRVKNEEYTDG